MVAAGEDSEEVGATGAGAMGAMPEVATAAAPAAVRKEVVEWAEEASIQRRELVAMVGAAEGADPSGVAEQPVTVG